MNVSYWNLEKRTGRVDKQWQSTAVWENEPNQSDWRTEEHRSVKITSEMFFFLSLRTEEASVWFSYLNSAWNFSAIWELCGTANIPTIKSDLLPCWSISGTLPKTWRKDRSVDFSTHELMMKDITVWWRAPRLPLSLSLSVLVKNNAKCLIINHILSQTRCPTSV